jgi:pimeloyl-ACP methyl ester carboxylesterase
MNVTTEDGRTLRVFVGGDEGGVPVFVHHGTPGSGVLWEGWVEAAAARRICLVGYDRPGYGGSTRQPGRPVADAVGDVRAIAGALGVRRLATWGVSGGGPHVLACAALAPELVAAAACVAGPMPYAGDDFWAGMSEENVQELGAALSGEEEVRAFVTKLGVAIQGGGTDELKEGLGSLLSPVDAAVLDRPFGTFLVEKLKDSVREGIDGWVDDDLAFVRDWGFDPGRVETPVLLIQGGHDGMVPRGHFDWLGARVAGAEQRFEPAHGHLSLSESGIPAVLDWLLEGRSIPRRG